MSGILNPTKSQFNIAKSHFASRYAMDKSAFEDIKINWLDFLSAVESLTKKWKNDETILRLIHRVDKGQWFLTLECCHVSKEGLLDEFSERLDLLNEKKPLLSNFKGLCDKNYFNSVKYNDSTLVKGIHVNYVLIPWVQEVKEGAIINDVLNSATANIVFSSCSFDYSDAPESVNVQWPHCVAFYFNLEGIGDLIDDVEYKKKGALIPFKAFDHCVPCPSMCGLYEWPDFFDATKPYNSKKKSPIFAACDVM